MTIRDQIDELRAILEAEVSPFAWPGLAFRLERLRADVAELEERIGRARRSLLEMTT